MIGGFRRRPPLLLAVAAIFALGVLFHIRDDIPGSSWLNIAPFQPTTSHEGVVDWQISDDYAWKTVPVHYPPTSLRRLPKGRAKSLPKVQADSLLSQETPEARATREARRDAVRAVFLKCWTSYRAYAWMDDELMPVSGGKRNPLGRWGATLVDSLDTLWIMGLHDEFATAATAAVEQIDFTKSSLEEINVFETTTRFLGGFLAAYDLSGDIRLLRKAVEVGEMLYKAFDTPNRMPVTRWKVHKAMAGERQIASDQTLSAEIGSLCLEFTRLSLITGDAKWYDATQRIAEALASQQSTSALSGMWPLIVNPRDMIFNKGDHFTMGAMADSLYEYLPKMSALVGGKLPEYQKMYNQALSVAADWLLFQPMTPTDEDILISGSVKADINEGERTVAVRLIREGQHLGCFVGGVYALGGKLYGKKDHLTYANKLVDGCVYTYKACANGVMPETFHMATCASREGKCKWDEMSWKGQVAMAADESDASQADAVIAEKHLPKGFTAIGDSSYMLRSEAIESVFVLYRATGREDLLEAAWDMFTAIDKVTSTALGNSAVSDVTNPGEASATDSMESFWMGETLKYFYLMFSEASLISLDDYVFNTEAHPLRRLTR